MLLCGDPRDKDPHRVNTSLPPTHTQIHFLGETLSNSLGKNRCEPEFLRTSSGKSKQVSRASAAHAKLKECFEVLQGLKETVSPAAKSEIEAFLLKPTKTMEETKDLEMDPKAALMQRHRSSSGCDHIIAGALASGCEVVTRPLCLTHN
jgi:hypothetical protein